MTKNVLVSNHAVPNEDSLLQWVVFGLGSVMSRSFFKEPEKVFQMKNLKYICIADFDEWAVVFPLVISGCKAFRNLQFLLSFHL